MFLVTASIGYKDTNTSYEPIRDPEDNKILSYEPRTYSRWVEGRSNPEGMTGVRITYTFNYEGQKIAKYCSVTCAPVNRVGDYVACRETGIIEKCFKLTGPFEPYVNGNYRSLEYEFWDGWLNGSIAKVEIVKVVIKYMDGSTEVITGEQLEEITRRKQEEDQRKQEEEKRREEEEWNNMSPAKRLFIRGCGCFIVVAISGLLFWLLFSLVEFFDKL